MGHAQAAWLSCGYLPCQDCFPTCIILIWKLGRERLAIRIWFLCLSKCCSWITCNFSCSILNSQTSSWFKLYFFKESSSASVPHLKPPMSDHVLTDIYEPSFSNKLETVLTNALNLSRHFFVCALIDAHKNTLPKNTSLHSTVDAAKEGRRQAIWTGSRKVS